MWLALSRLPSGPREVSSRALDRGVLDEHGARKDEVYLYVNTGRQLWRSTNGGLLFDLIGVNMPVTGKLLVDPLKPAGGLIGPALNAGPAAEGTAGSTPGGVAISGDEGHGSC